MVLLVLVVFMFRLVLKPVFVLVLVVRIGDG